MTREVYVLVLTRPDTCTVEEMKKFVKRGMEYWSSVVPKKHPLYLWFTTRREGSSVEVCRRESPSLHDLTEAVAAGHALIDTPFDAFTREELQRKFREIAVDVFNRLELDPRKPVEYNGPVRPAIPGQS